MQEADSNAPKEIVEPRLRRPLFRRLVRWSLAALLFPVGLLILVSVALYIPAVQDLVRGKAVAFLHEKLGAEVALEKLVLRFPLGVSIQGLYIEDLSGDTLISAGELKARVSLTGLFNERIHLTGLSLSDTRANLAQDADSTFNFQFIVDAFTSDSTVAAEPTEGKGWTFTVDGIALKAIHFTTDLRPSRMELDLHLGELHLPLEAFDLDSMRFHAGELRITDTRIAMCSAPSAPSPDTYPNLESPFGELDLALASIVLDRVAFSSASIGSVDSLSVGLVHAQLDVERMDTRRQLFHLAQVMVEGLVYTVVSDSVGEKLPGGSEPAWLGHDDGFRYFLRDLDVRIGRLELHDAALGMHAGRVAPPGSTFDPAHVVLAGVNAQLNGVVANNDEVRVVIEDLHGRYGSSEHLFQLKSDIRGTAAELVLTGTRLRWDGLLAELDVHTRQGSLENAYRTPERVPIHVRLKTTIPQEHQAQLFALLPAGMLPITNIPEGFSLGAHLAGTLERMDTIAVDLHGDAGTTLNVNGSVVNAMHPDRMNVDLNVDPFIMGAGTRMLMGAFIPDKTLVPSRLQVRSAIQGGPNRIKASLDLRSDLGDVVGHSMITGSQKDLPDALEMDVRATGVALARILGDTAWRDADVRIQAEARALNTPQRQGWLEVRPTRLMHESADLSVAYLRADLTGDSILALVDVESEPLALRLKAAGTWPAKENDLTADVDLEVGRADLEVLGLTDHALAIIGDWNGRLAIDTLGQVTFNMNMDSTRLENGTEQFVFETLDLRWHLGADSTSASVASDALDLSFNANIGVDTLLVRVKEKGRSIFTSDTAYHTLPGGRFDLSVDLKRSEWLAGMVLPNLHAIELQELAAHYDSDADELNARIMLPKLLYDSLEVNDIAFNMAITGGTLDTRLRVEHVAQGAYHIDGLTADVSGSGGDLSGDLRIGSTEEARYHIGARMQQVPDGLEFSLAPELVLDQQPWQVDPQNRLLVTDERITATDLDLRSGEQQVTLRTLDRALEIDLGAFRISTLANVISSVDSVPIINGSIDGLIRLPARGSAGMNADLTIAELQVMATELGTLDVVVLGEANEHYRGNVALSRSSNELEAKFDLAPESERAMASMDLRDISFLEPFVSEYLYEMAGGLDGVVDYSRVGERTSLRGRLHFKQASVGVVATGATYTLADEVLVMTDQGLHFDSFRMLDSLGNAFLIDGDVRTVMLDKPMLDLRIRTDRFQLVSSTIEQNPRFFGELFARIDLQANGRATRPNVKGGLTILPGTVFSVVLPGTTVELVNAEGIVVFTDDLYAVDSLALNADAALLRDSLEALLPGVELDLNIKVDKEAVFAIVLDPAAGDQATVSGTADLVFRYAPGSSMYLSGPFMVERGEYTLDLYGLVKKRFELVKGGSVRWSGDPVKAEMDLRARYRSDTAPYALVASGNTMMDAERNRLQQPLPFDVLIDITGSMSGPDIGFGIDLERQVRNSFPKVSEQLDRLNQPGNNEELNRQVFGLLVLNSFLVDEGSGGDPSSGIATSAARNSVNGLLTEQMNKLTGRYLKGVDVSLGVNTYDQSSGQSTYQRTSLDYRVSKRLLNDRLSFEVGGSVGVDEQNSQVSNVSNTRAAQYAILYDLTTDGRFRIRGFHENAFDLYDGEITNSGVAIMFTKDIEENERARTKARKLILEERERNATEQQQEVELEPTGR